MLSPQEGVSMSFNVPQSRNAVSACELTGHTTRLFVYSLNLEIKLFMLILLIGFN